MNVKLSEQTQIHAQRALNRVSNPLKYLKNLVLFGVGYALGKASPRLREKFQQHNA